jgi:hypothetical protein
MLRVNTIVLSKLRNDRFFRRFVSDSFVNYEGHICVPHDHNSLQAACERLQVSVWQFWQLNGF